MQYKSYNNNSNYFYLILLFLLFFGGFRVIFALIGLFFSFLPLIIFAFFLYQSIKGISRNSGINSYLHTQTTEHNKFIELLARASAHLINIDGHVEEVEIQTFKNFFTIHFRFQGYQLQWVEDLLQNELKNSHNIDLLCAEINAQFTHDIKLALLDLLYQIAVSDFEFHPKEEELINRIAAQLNIPQYELDILAGRYQQKGKSATGEEKYYRVLGLSKGASPEEVKRAYRTLVKKFHPDVVATLGDEMKAINEQKIREITEAYNQLTKVHSC
ncbi:MAG: TerB family tellurite resistance protein [Candidatus Margulisiibacteriota bacterium]